MGPIQAKPRASRRAGAFRHAAWAAVATAARYCMASIECIVICLCDLAYVQHAEGHYDGGDPRDA